MHGLWERKSGYDPLRRYRSSRFWCHQRIKLLRRDFGYFNHSKPYLYYFGRWLEQWWKGEVKQINTHLSSCMRAYPFNPLLITYSSACMAVPKLLPKLLLISQIYPPMCRRIMLTWLSFICPFLIFHTWHFHLSCSYPTIPTAIFTTMPTFPSSKPAVGNPTFQPCAYVPIPTTQIPHLSISYPFLSLYYHHTHTMLVLISQDHLAYPQSSSPIALHTKHLPFHQLFLTVLMFLSYPFSCHLTQVYVTHARMVAQVVVSLL